MVGYKTVVRVFVVSAVLVIVCALSTSTQAYSFSITFDMRGSEGIAMDGLASGSVTKDGLTATFTGMVLALQSYTGFSRFDAESSIPTVVVLSVTRELGPVLALRTASGLKVGNPHIKGAKVTGLVEAEVKGPKIGLNIIRPIAVPHGQVVVRCAAECADLIRVAV